MMKNTDFHRLRAQIFTEGGGGSQKPLVTLPGGMPAEEQGRFAPLDLFSVQICALNL